MANPTLEIVKGPGRRDLELAFMARHLGAVAAFTIKPELNDWLEVKMHILNFSHVTCHGPNYQLGGELADLLLPARARVPKFNFIFVEYNVETKMGGMEFSNGE